jgi:serine phosphatase RsbU (regulator of sigma subunit)
MLDREGRVREANERARSYFPQSIIGKNINSLFAGIDVPVSSISTTQIVQSFHVNSIPKKGEKKNFLLSIIPLNSEERARGVMVVGRDVSEIDLYRNEIEQLWEQNRNLEKELQLLRNEGGGEDMSPSLATALSKLEKVKEELEERNQNLINQMELAAVLQKTLVPHEFPEDRYLQFAFYFEPMQFVGGDYYDVIELGNGRKGLIIADVSGHGVSSAFIAAMLKISFLNYAPMYKSPAAVLAKLNQEYCRLIQTGDFVTAFYAVFDPLQKKLTYCGAGHPRPVYFNGHTGKIHTLDSRGFFIGMFDQAEYRDLTIELCEGDRLMVFTDGIIEAYSDEKKEQYGEKRLLTCFKRCCNLSIEGMIDFVVDDVKDFMKKSIFYDDLAIVIAQLKEAKRIENEAEHD